MTDDDKDRSRAAGETLAQLAAVLLPIRDAMMLAGDAVKAMLPMSRYISTVLERLPAEQGPTGGEAEELIRPVLEAAAALAKAWDRFETEMIKSGKPNPFAN